MAKKKKAAKPTEGVTVTERMLNSGREITLKDGTTLTVRELSMEDTVKCANSLVRIIATIGMMGDDEANPIIVIGSILADQSTAPALRSVAGVITQEDSKFWEERPLLDWMKLIEAAKAVIDWEEMKELFMMMGMDKIFQSGKTDQAPTTDEALEDQTNETLPTL